MIHQLVTGQLIFPGSEKYVEGDKERERGIDVPTRRHLLYTLHALCWAYDWATLSLWLILGTVACVPIEQFFHFDLV